MIASVLFSAPMVRALLDGRKTQTRRALKPQPFADGYFDGEIDCTFVPARASNLPAYFRFGASAVGGGAVRTETWTPRVAVGDRLWVRETFHPSARGPIFRADAESVVAWKSPIHMPRKFSRLTLTVTEVRVQRLQEISEEDAIAEGVVDTGRRDGAPYSHCIIPGMPEITMEHEPSSVFAALWEHINGDGSWKANPWVAAYTFTVERRNIDALTAEAA